VLEVLGDDERLEKRGAGKRILTGVGVTERLARASSRHPWRTILAWVGAIVVALVLAATLLPGNLTTNGHVTGNPQSKQAENLFQQRFPPDKNAVDELIVIRSAAQTVNDPAFTSFLTCVPRRPQRGLSTGTRPSASPATGTRCSSASSARPTSTSS
jgi:hypothetical protein